MHTSVPHFKKALEMSAVHNNEGVKMRVFTQFATENMSIYRGIYINGVRINET